MTSMPLPNEASQLAAALELGEPIRVYRTTKRRQFKISCWVLAFIYLVFIINLFAQTHFRITQIYVFVYYLGAAVMLALALSFFIPLLLIRKTTVYICASGFILYHKRKCQVVRWEDIEWVSSNNQSPHIVYLANKKRVILSQLIDNVQALAQEIEIKARLIKHPQGQETLEAQFEQLLRIQTTREQDAQLQKKPGPIEQESPEEAFKLQAEYQLGEVVATYHGGFRGILRANVLSFSIYYLLLLAFAFLFIGMIIHFSFIPGALFLNSNVGQLEIAVFVLSFLFMPRFFARFVRLHLYTEGFIYIDGRSIEAIRWEQIEKLIYHKPLPTFSPPFCHIYLTNGDALTISRYIQKRRLIKQALDEHVIHKLLVG